MPVCQYAVCQYASISLSWYADMPVCQYDMQTYKLRGTVLACYMLYDPICINLNQGTAQLIIKIDVLCLWPRYSRG